MYINYLKKLLFLFPSGYIFYIIYVRIFMVRPERDLDVLLTDWQLFLTIAVIIGLLIRFYMLIKEYIPEKTTNNSYYWQKFLDSAFYFNLKNKLVRFLDSVKFHVWIKFLEYILDKNINLNLYLIESARLALKTTKKFRIILILFIEFLPRLLVIVVFIFEILYYKKLNYFYKALSILIIPAAFHFFLALLNELFRENETEARQVLEFKKNAFGGVSIEFKKNAKPPFWVTKPMHYYIYYYIPIINIPVIKQIISSIQRDLKKKIFDVIVTIIYIIGWSIVIYFGFIRYSKHWITISEFFKNKDNTYFFSSDVFFGYAYYSILLLLSTIIFYVIRKRLRKTVLLLRYTNFFRLLKIFFCFFVIGYIVIFFIKRAKNKKNNNILLLLIFILVFCGVDFLKSRFLPTAKNLTQRYNPTGQTRTLTVLTKISNKITGEQGIEHNYFRPKIIENDYEVDELTELSIELGLVYTLTHSVPKSDIAEKNNLAPIAAAVELIDRDLEGKVQYVTFYWKTFSAAMFEAGKENMALTARVMTKTTKTQLIAALKRIKKEWEKNGYPSPEARECALRILKTQNPNPVSYTPEELEIRQKKKEDKELRNKRTPEEKAQQIQKARDDALIRKNAEALSMRALGEHTKDTSYAAWRIKEIKRVDARKKGKTLEEQNIIMEEENRVTHSYYYNIYEKKEEID